MVQTTNSKGAVKTVVVSIIPWLQVRILPVLFRFQFAKGLILAELRKQSGELIRDINRTARAVPLKRFYGFAKKS